MKKILCLIAIIGACFGTWQFLVTSKHPALPLVVISQIIDHDALDHEREGIITALAEGGFIEGKTVTLLYRSAQGNVTTAQQIATDFASRKPAVAVGISTPSAQTLMQPMAQHGIPLVFTAVTDPVAAKLVSHLAAPRSENITGVSDGAPIQQQLQLIQELVPSIRTIGILYNPGEANSARIVEEFRTLATKKGFSLLYAATPKTADTIAAAQSLVGKVQAIFIPNDNTVMASIASVAALAREHKIPLFNPDYDAVERGILATRACSHSAMGYKAGQMVARILKGEKASDIPIEQNHTLELAINVTAARLLDIQIPEALKKTAKLFS